MIHRAILGSLERFLGILIEHYAAKFPLWLSPEQVRVMAISEKTNDYAKIVYDKLKNAGLRAGIDVSDEKIGAKIARAHADKLPFMLVVGPKEVQDDAVNVRIRGQKDNKNFKIDEFIPLILQKITKKDENLVL